VLLLNKRLLLFRYRFSPETFGYTLVRAMLDAIYEHNLNVSPPTALGKFHTQQNQTWNCVPHNDETGQLDDRGYIPVRSRDSLLLGKEVKSVKLTTNLHLRQG